MRKVKGTEAPHESTTSGNATLPLQVKVGVAHSQGAEGVWFLLTNQTASFIGRRPAQVKQMFYTSV